MLSRIRNCLPHKKISFSVSTLNVIIATVSIIVAAGATLGITLYFSIDSAHKLASSSVRVMADKARDQMIAFVTQPVSAAVSTQYGSHFGDMGDFSKLPSETGAWDDPHWYFPWERIQAQQMAEVDFKYQYATFGWEDGYYVGCKVIPENASIFQCRSYSRRNRTSISSRLVERNFSRATGHLLGESHSFSNYDHRRREWYYMTNHEEGVRKWSDVYLSAMPTLPVVDLHASLTNASGHFLGIIGWSYELNELDAELKKISPSMGSTVVLLDNKRRVLASSIALNTYSKLSVPRGYNLTAEELANGCVISDENTATLSIRVCQHDIDSFGYGPLTVLRNKYPELLAPNDKLDPYAPPPTDPSTTVVLDKLSDKSYYAAVIDLSTHRATNMNWLVISFLPETSVTASIIKGRDVAIGVAVGLVIAITVVVGVIVKVMLSPLSLIASRMETAAYLRVRGGGARFKGDSTGTSSGDDHKGDEDEEETHEKMRERAQAAEDALIKERKMSYLSDVAAIQNAYWDMADELWALKGYIPEHVTRGVVAKIAARRAEQSGGGGVDRGGTNEGIASDGISLGGDSSRSRAALERKGRNSNAGSLSSREMTPANNVKSGLFSNSNTNKNNTTTKGALAVTTLNGGALKRLSQGDMSSKSKSKEDEVNPPVLMGLRDGHRVSEGISQADLEAIQQLSPEAVVAEHVIQCQNASVGIATKRGGAVDPLLLYAGGSTNAIDHPPISTALPYFSPFDNSISGANAKKVGTTGQAGGEATDANALSGRPAGKGPLGETTAFRGNEDAFGGALYTPANGGADGKEAARVAAVASGDPNKLAIPLGVDVTGTNNHITASGSNNNSTNTNTVGTNRGGLTSRSNQQQQGASNNYNGTNYNSNLHANSLRTQSTMLTDHSDDGAFDVDDRLIATMGSAENVSVAANRLAGLAKVEEDVPIFFGDNVLVDRDITIVHLNIVNFHKYCRVTHGKDLKQEHEVLVNLVYSVARRCGGVLDTFSGDKFFVSFNAASKCVDHPIAAVCFAHEVSSIVTKDAIWGMRRRKIEQQCRNNNMPIPRDSKAFPPHVYKAAPFGITCGVATGRAFVGPLGFERILRHSVLSNAMTESVALERLCLKYPACRILIAGDLITMVDSCFAYQLLDAAVLPGTQGRRRRLASVKGPLRRNDLTVFRGGCRGMAAKSRTKNIYAEMNDCFLAYLEGRGEKCRQALEEIDAVIERETRRLVEIADAEKANAEALAATAGPGVVSPANTAGTNTPTPNGSNPSDVDAGPDAPMTDEECADMVIMSQFIWSLLQSDPPLDGRMYRSPLGETYQPIQHALYLVQPRWNVGPNGLPLPNVLRNTGGNGSSGDER